MTFFKQTTKKQLEPMAIERHDIDAIEKDLIARHPDLIVRGLTEMEVREELKDIIKKDYAGIVGKNDERADYIVQEIVGTGVIEEIIQNELDLTDIGFCGDYLTVEGINKFERRYDEHINEDYIQRIIQRFANAVKMDFSPKNPRFKAVFGNMRLSAIHKQNSNSGTTLSIRIVRPVLALDEKNFDQFAPMFMLDLLRVGVETRQNMLIAGETGTGKTELQKLAFSFLDNEQKVFMIEDVPETFVKQLFPEKYIYSVLTGNGVTHNMLIEDAMRNNARWVFVSEIINEAALGLYHALITGHNIITTLHAIDAFTMPKRMAQLAKMGDPTANEEAILEDIFRYMNFGWHIKRDVYNGRTYRYLHQVVAYEPGNKSTLVFEQELYHGDGTLRWKTGVLPAGFKELLVRKGVHFDFPENSTNVIKLEEGLVA